jgi:hypothetical protein
MWSLNRVSPFRLKLHTETLPGMMELDYPFHDQDALVTACGRICRRHK